MISKDWLEYDEVLNLLRNSSNFQEIKSREVGESGFSGNLRYYLSKNYSRAFLIKNTSFGLIIDPPNFYVNKEIVHPRYFWFEYFFSRSRISEVDPRYKIEICNRISLENILEHLEGKPVIDDIIFNLNLLT